MAIGAARGPRTSTPSRIGLLRGRRRPPISLASSELPADRITAPRRPKGGSRVVGAGPSRARRSRRGLRPQAARWRGFRRVGLDDGAAGLVGAACPARDLQQELEGALACTQVSAAQAGVGVDHAYQRQRGEVVTLGNDLRADEDIDLAALHAGDQFAQHLRATSPCPTTELRRVRPRSGVDLFRQTLHARADACERALGAAVRTLERLLHGEAGEVADQQAGIAMLGEPGIRIRRFQPLAARPAEHERRIAAAVEEEQRLFLVGQRLLDGLRELRRDPAASLEAAAGGGLRARYLAVLKRRGGR